MLKIRLNQLKCAFICIDAIDELKQRVCRQLLNTLKGAGSNTRLLLTGRGHIESEVQGCFQVTQRYTVTISANKQDIETFVS